MYIPLAGSFLESWSFFRTTCIMRAKVFALMMQSKWLIIRPSIAQLEERETVMDNISSQGHWFDPGSKDVVFLRST